MTPEERAAEVMKAISITEPEFPGSVMLIAVAIRDAEEAVRKQCAELVDRQFGILPPFRDELSNAIRGGA